MDKPAVVDYEFDFFFSHAWGQDKLGRENHDRVAQLKRMLEEQHNLRVWLDDEQISKDNAGIDHAMVNGISTSKLVAVFITQRYIDKIDNGGVSDNCLAEWNAALRSNANIVPVVAEPQLKDQKLWGHRLVRLHQLHYIDMSSDDDACLRQACEQLAARIKPVPPQTASSATDDPSWTVTENAIADILTKQYQRERHVPILGWMGKQLQMDLETTYTNLRVTLFERYKPRQSDLLDSSTSSSDADMHERGRRKTTAARADADSNTSANGGRGHGTGAGADSADDPQPSVVVTVSTDVSLVDMFNPVKLDARQSAITPEPDKNYLRPQMHHHEHENASHEPFQHRRVVAVGRPGIGKSTLLRKITYDWATQRLWNSQFNLVFLIRLRDNIPDDKEATLPQIIINKCLKGSRAVSPESIDDLLYSRGERILFLLDGYDEFQPELCPALDRLINGKSPGYHDCSILVTSRPNKADDLLLAEGDGQFTQQLQVVGFTASDTREFVLKHFDDDPSEGSKMLEVLQDRTRGVRLRSAAQVPILALLLCLQWRNLKSLPDTMTTLFERLTESVVGYNVRRLGKQAGRHQWDAADSEKVLDRLGRLAYVGMEQKRILFLSKDPLIQSLKDEDKHFAEYGLLTSEAAGSYDASTSYTFVHLNFQEYLAARYYVKEKEHVGRRSISSWFRKRVQTFHTDPFFHVMWQFVCGILKDEAEDLMETIRVKGRKQRWLIGLLLQCQQESRSEKTKPIVSRALSRGVLDLRSPGLTPADLEVVAEALQADAASFAKVKVIDLRGTVVTQEMAEELLAKVPLDQQSFYIRPPQAEADGVQTLMRLGWTTPPSSKELEELRVNVTPRWCPRRTSKMSRTDFPVLVANIAVKRDDIESLDLGGNNIGSAGAAVLANAITANLKWLGLSGNNLGHEGARALSNALKSNRSLQGLGLASNNIGDKGAAAVADMLQGETRLQKITLSGNAIGDEGATSLSKALKSNTCLQDMSLVSNTISDKGASALSKALDVNTSLRMLDMAHNSLSDEAKQSLKETARARQGPVTLIIAV